MSKYSKLLIGLFSIALFTRLIFFFCVVPYKPLVQSQYILQGDAPRYHLLAQTLISSKEFALHPGETPEILRTPGYPFFVGLLYYLFGIKPWVPIFFQLLLDSVSCLLLYEIVLKFSNSRIALFASLFYAFDPFFIFYSVTLLSEILFIFLLLVAALFFTKVIENNFTPASKMAICIAGLFFGLATLVRPISMYLIIVIPIYLFFLFRYNRKYFVTRAILFATMFLLAISPWIVRNLLTFNSILLSTSGPYNLLILYISPMEAERRGGLSTHDIKKQLTREVDTAMIHNGFNPSQLDGVQRSKYYQMLAIQYIANDPKSFLKHYCLGIIHSFANLNTKGFAEALDLPSEEGNFEMKGQKNLQATIAEFIKRKTPYEIVIGVSILFFLLVEYFCLTIGIIISYKDLKKSFLLFCLMMSAYFILLAGPFGLARFRLPAIPFYLVFVGIGINYLFSKMQRKLGIRNSSEQI